jgi:flagellar biogenesis protein FliO
MKTQRSRAQVSARRVTPAPVQSLARPLLVFPGEASSKTLQKANGQVSDVWRKVQKQLLNAWGNAAKVLSSAGKSAKAQISRSWKSLRAQQIARSGSKRLHVAATVSLGEKRFVAVIQVDGKEFLVGGGATNVALLAQLGARKSFDGVLTETMNLPEGLAPQKQPTKRVRKKMVAAVEKVGEEA